MDDLILAAWDEYSRFTGDPSLVVPSMPILYFGDRDQYLASEYRVVTVGLNPSRAEFPAKVPSSRFSGVPTLPATFPSSITLPVYRHALDSYFRTDPYNRWFECFRRGLDGLHASYDRTQPNRALHTDLCSPLATNPTWSRLSRHIREKLRSGGTDLWHRLIIHLRPHVIIMSVRDEYRAAVCFQPLGEWHTLLEIKYKKDGGNRRKPYSILVRSDNTAMDLLSLSICARVLAPRRPLPDARVCPWMCYDDGVENIEKLRS